MPIGHFRSAALVALSVLAGTALRADDLTIPHAFVSGTPALASEVNANFAAVEASVDDNDQRISALEGSASANVITVDLVGGDFTSVAAAMASIADAAANNPYLVQVMPGVYSETELVKVPSFVHLRGSGPGTTIVTSSRSAGAPGGSSATVELDDAARISDVTVRNEGTSTYGIAIITTLTTRSTVVDNVVAEVVGASGVGGHYAAYWNDSEAIIRNSRLSASGASGFGTAVNAAFGSVNISAGFPSALIENSILIGGLNNSLESCTDNTGTGFALQLSNSSPLVRSSYLCGGRRAVSLVTNGHPRLQNSAIQVSSTSGSFLFEITASGSISVANSGVSYLGNKFTGAGTVLRCIHSYSLGTYQAVSDGTTTATSCN